MLNGFGLLRPQQPSYQSANFAELQLAHKFVLYVCMICFDFGLFFSVDIETRNCHCLAILVVVVYVCVFVKDRIYLNIKYTAICLAFQFADYCWWGCCMFGSYFSIHLLSVRLFMWLLVAFYHVKLRIGLQFTNNNNNIHHSKWPNKKNRIEWGTKKKSM